MQSMRNSVLSHVRIRVPMGKWCLGKDVKATKSFCQQLCTSIGTDHDVTMARVIELVKKSGKLDANKVTEIADFQKDLSLDSLDRVELVMAFEEEFSVEIPDKEADGLKCCADVTKYIISRAKETTDRI